MKKIIFCLLIIAATANDVFAQDEFDALRYSFTPSQGTARGMGIGGTVGSIGADFSSLSINPAGLGVYKSNEFMFTPTFNAGSNKSTYLGTEASANTTKLNFSNFGIVVTNNLQAKSFKPVAWKTFSFGFGMNRLATYKNEYTYTGTNNKSSFTESFADDFNSLGGITNTSINTVNFSAFGAYQTYLIDSVFGSNSVRAVSYVPYEAGIKQTKKVTESGGMNEYVLSLGGNYKDKLMLGATIGLISSKYERRLRFSEEDASGNLNNDFKYMNYNENLKTEGSGINLKIGAIYKPNKNFRVGLALHTPTHIAFNDASTISIESHTDSLKQFQNPFDPITKYAQDSALVFNYTLNTPYKAVGSLFLLFGKMGFMTADVEYVDYASMKYNYGIGYDNESDAINKVIQNTFKDAVNLRVGAEAKLDKVSLRGGFAYYGSPYAKNSDYGSRTNISGGIGYRDQYWFIDATYIFSMQKNLEFPYVLAREDANVQPAIINNRIGSFAITLGVKF